MHVLKSSIFVDFNMGEKHLRSYRDLICDCIFLLNTFKDKLVFLYVKTHSSVTEWITQSRLT